MHFGIFYFSATGITKIISKEIERSLKQKGYTIHVKNIITPKSRESKPEFSEFDGIFFGFPVFGGRIPIVVEEWLSKLEGKNKNCAMFFTYGGRAIEWAHQSTYYLLTRANFRVVLSAEFVGSHSFNIADGWNLAESRPNEFDLKVAEQFALESIVRFRDDSFFDIDLSGFSYRLQRTKISKGMWAKLYPHKTQKECQMCRLCEMECPVNAFDAESGKTNKKLCICCMHCVTICPDQVINVGDVSKLFTYFTERLGLTQEVVNKKKSRILTTFPP